MGHGGGPGGALAHAEAVESGTEPEGGAGVAAAAAAVEVKGADELHDNALDVPATPNIRVVHKGLHAR